MVPGIKIKPLLHWSFGIRDDIALPTGRAISLRIPKDQCNNVLVFRTFLSSIMSLMVSSKGRWAHFNVKLHFFSFLLGKFVLYNVCIIFDVFQRREILKYEVVLG